MTKTPDSFDTSIPVLTDVVVPGKPELARAALSEAAFEYDAAQVAERLRARVGQYLETDARALIAARCEEVLREHAQTLVEDITREVAVALDGRLREWVGAAVEEELRRQRES